jgi:hypothetical protein
MRVAELRGGRPGKHTSQCEAAVAGFDTLDKRTVILTWLLRGIEDFFMAFKIEDFFSRYRPFFYAMGFEMVCKAYLLGSKAAEYERLEKKQAVAKIDTIAKKLGHNVSRLSQDLSECIGGGKIEAVLKKDFDGFTGDQLLAVIEAAYLESRYPVPNPIHEKFPVENGEGICWEPLYSSGLEKFCHAFTREILDGLKQNFGITIRKTELDERLTGDARLRFCNLLFDGKINEFVKG